MKISTKLALAVVVPFVMALVVAVVLLVSYRSMLETQKNGDVVRQLRTDVTNLNGFISSYLLYHEERPKQQFSAENALALEIIGQARFGNVEELNLIEKVRLGIVAMNQTFLSLVANYDRGQSSGNSAVANEVEQRLAGQLLIQSQDTDSSAALLQSVVDTDINKIELRTVSLVALVLILTTLPLTLVLVRTRRSITSSLSTLSNGAAVIGSGNLDYRIDEGARDETGDLSRAFNRMTSDLKAITASKSELEKEISKRAEVEEELRVVNEQLQAQATDLEDEIAERKVVELALRKEQARTSADLEAMTRLQTISLFSLAQENLEPVLGEIVDAAIAISNADFGNIQILDEAASELKIIVQRGFPQWWLDYWANVSRGQGCSGTALELGERVIVEDVEKSPIFAGTQALDVQLKAGVRAVQSTPLTSRAGKPLGMFSTHYKQPFRPDERTLGLLDLLARQAGDIIEHVQNQQALRRYTAELEVANQELESFSYSVSHDLRAPLRGMDGFSQILLEDYAGKLDSTGQDYLKNISSSSQLMAKLIDDILTISRITRAALEVTPVDLSALAEEVKSELTRQQPERQIEFRIAPGLGASGDRALLKLVLQNLCENAYKFTLNNPAALIEFGATERAGKTAYFLRDNGAGFDMAHVDKLFKPFQRLHSSKEFPGTGIGLASVHRIISRHGGKVWAEAEVGKGATFYFTLGN